MAKSIKNLSNFEKGLWLFSVITVIISFLIAGKYEVLTLIASLTGVTALIFVAKGDVLGQILTVIFSLLYGIISISFKYYGEMITYLGMTTPIAVISIVTWLKHPYKEKQVKVNRINRKSAVILIFLTAFVTFIFYFILKFFGNANLIVSTISVATSFLASSLMMLRNPYYAVCYALNDVVLIILWILASMEDISFLPMIICFLMFLINDIYGFYNWLKMENEQKF